MGIRSRLRSILPPTNRHFEAEIASLHDDLARVGADSDAALRTAFQELLAENRALRDSLAEANERLGAVQEKFRYGSFEYLTLDRARSGRRILLAGWYGASNCGDELMLQSILQHFEGRGVRVSVLLWDDPDYDIRSLPAFVDPVHYPRSRWELRQLAEYFDALVWGGGAIIDDGQFNDDVSNFNTGNLLIWLSEEMIARGKDVYAVGLSANERLAAGGEYARRLAGVFAGCHHVSLRDGYSRDVLAGIGVDVSTIELCEDVVFGSRAIGNVATSKDEKGPFVLGFVPIFLPGLEEHNRHVLSLLAELLKQRYGADFRIRLIPFYDFWHFDTVHFDSLLEGFDGADFVEVAPYCTDLMETPLRSCDAVVGYRYHACLVSAASAIPTLFMCVNSHPHYRNKMRHLAELFSAERNLVECSSTEDDGALRSHFVDMLEKPVRPVVPKDLFATVDTYLDRLCSRIVKGD